MRFEIELDDESMHAIPGARNSYALGTLTREVFDQIAAQLPTTFPVTMPAELARWLADQPDDWPAERPGTNGTNALRYLAAAARRHLPPKE